MVSHYTHIFKASIIFVIICGTLSQTREFSVAFNPNCTITACHSPATKNLVHIQAKGSNDTIHYIWSTIQQPSLLIARTELESQVHVDWSKCCDSLQSMTDFSSTPLYLYHTSLDQLLEFTDPKDTANLPDANYTTGWNLSSLQWQDANSSIQITDDYIAAIFHISNVSVDSLPPNGTIALTLRVFKSEGLTPRLPNLPHSDTTAQLVLDFDNLPTTTDHDRLAMVMSVSYSGVNSSQLRHTISSTMDDEYSPGVFKDITIEDAGRGFTLWKPAAYLSKNHEATQTTNVDMYIPQESCAPHPAWGLDLYTCPFNVSFGMPADGFYTKSNYTSWTLVTGLGPTPASGMSLFAYIFLSTGLGIPTLLFVGAIIYLIVLRLRNKDKPDEKALVDPSACN